MFSSFDIMIKSRIKFLSLNEIRYMLSQHRMFLGLIHGDSRIFLNGVGAKHTIFCIAFIQYWTNIEDVGPKLYTFKQKFLCLLGVRLKKIINRFQSKTSV